MSRAILLLLALLLVGCAPLVCKGSNPEDWCPPAGDEYAADAFEPEVLAYCEARS